MTEIGLIASNYALLISNRHKIGVIYSEHGLVHSRLIHSASLQKACRNNDPATSFSKCSFHR